MKVRFSYLKEKFNEENAERIWARMKPTVTAGGFTLGKEVLEFEAKFAAMMGCKYAIACANGTDALELSLWAVGVRAGDEVIAPANTFVASLGCIGNLQATPVLVDVGPNYVIDASKIEAAITPKTKAIIPVSFTGYPCDMDEIMRISEKHKIPVIEDDCQSYLAEYKGKCVGNFGVTGCFSLHPLKILNVWGDSGAITTNDKAIYDSIKLHQNHGLFTRDIITEFPCRNSRMDSIHAAVANSQLDGVPENVAKRRANAAYYDKKLTEISGVYVEPRRDDIKSVYHLYFFEVDAYIREDLYDYLLKNDIEAKIHYKTPLYQQPGLSKLGYKRGDFPEADRQCSRIITIPVDENVTVEMQDYVIKVIKEFMESKLSRRKW